MKMYGRRAHEKTCCRWCHPWGSRDKRQIKAEEEREWRGEAEQELYCGFCSGRTKIPEPGACDFCYHLTHEPGMLNLDESTWLRRTPAQIDALRQLAAAKNKCRRGHENCPICEDDKFDW